MDLLNWRNNSMWRDLQRKRPGEVSLEHVRSHINIPGNELADELADGRGSMNSISRARQWMRAYVTKLQTRASNGQLTTDGVTARRQTARPTGNDQAGSCQPPGSQGPGTLGDRVGVG